MTLKSGIIVEKRGNDYLLDGDKVPHVHLL